MKKAIVTGATGMIGASLARQMLADGVLVTAVVRPNSIKMDNVPVHENLKIVACGADELSALADSLPKDYDVFFNMAWKGPFGADRDNLYLQNSNVRNTLRAVDLAADLGCKVFIGAGSQAEYGHAEGTLSDETPKNPVTGYGGAKYMAGLMSRIRCEQRGLRQCWGRIVSAYGPGDNPYTLVMSAVNGMLRGKRLKFTKGDQLWDYTYVDDCANAFYRMALQGKHGKAYTIGSGSVRRLADFIAATRDAVDPALAIGIGEIDYYPNQVMRLQADIRDLQADTGYCPAVSFEEGIRRTVQWAKERL